jgi:hypothetical protein
METGAVVDVLRIPLVALASAALALSGCSTSDSGAAGSPTPSPSPTVPPGYVYGPVSVSLDNPAPAVFDGASVDARQATPPIDVVSLQFTGGMPGCEIRYVDPPVTDRASGEPVNIEGNAFLQVSCQPVTSLGPDTDRYSSPDTQNVTEIVKSGYDGSTLNWTIGLERRAPFGGGIFSGGWIELNVLQ